MCFVQAFAVVVTLGYCFTTMSSPGDSDEFPLILLWRGWGGEGLCSDGCFRFDCNKDVAMATQPTLCQRLLGHHVPIPFFPFK